jgi:hypothetical protein
MKTETKVGIGVALALVGYYLYNKSKSTPQPTKLVEKIKTNSVSNLPSTPTSIATPNLSSGGGEKITAAETIKPVLTPIIEPIVAPIIPIVSPPAANPIDVFIPPTKVEPISNPIIDIIIPPSSGGGGGDAPSLPNLPAPIYMDPINYPTEPTIPERKGTIEIGQLDQGQYVPPSGGGGDAPIIPTPIYQPPNPIDVFIPPASSSPEPTRKGDIEIGNLDQGQYGPAADEIPNQPSPIIIGSGSAGGGGSSAGGDFGGGGGNFGSGIGINDWIFLPTGTTRRGSIEVGDLDQGEYE